MKNKNEDEMDKTKKTKTLPNHSKRNLKSEEKKALETELTKWTESKKKMKNTHLSSLPRHLCGLPL